MTLHVVSGTATIKDSAGTVKYTSARKTVRFTDTLSGTFAMTTKHYDGDSIRFATTTDLGACNASANFVTGPAKFVWTDGPSNGSIYRSFTLGGTFFSGLAVRNMIAAGAGTVTYGRTAGGSPQFCMSRGVTIYPSGGRLLLRQELFIPYDDTVAVGGTGSIVAFYGNTLYYNAIVGVID